ncbi:glycosyltransferase family 4 protein [Acidisoma silvae]|uniref:Glycosyltransferase family 4 protein n=1 Tax=Acidisoma silvae TaxID=2802396 RepID=A0A964DX00_9PROT|nr:glycosyltransferase family 4 protein [Acidisoma silvae]MCB8873631.1 glycosyltransferase family 4 protein [Acidisoma silvae]
MGVITQAMQPVLPPGPIRVFSDHEPEALRQLERGRNIFHFGNNSDHVFLVPLFHRYGGVAVVHDATLHYLAECTNDVIPGFFEASLAEEQPQRAEALMRLWRQPGFKRVMDYQEIKLLSWLNRASAIIVHSHFAARVVGARLPGMPIHVIPHFAYPSAIGPDGQAPLKQAARTRLNIAQDRFVVTTLGFVTANKQYDAIIRAMMQLPADLRARATFLIAGQVRPHEYDVERVIDQFGMRGQVMLTGFLSEARMRDVLLASDLICNLRYPTFGESSGSLSRALGLGCGIAVTDTGSYAEMPAGTCFRIPAKADPSRELAELFGQLMTEPAILRAHRQAGYAHARDDLSPALMARRYEEIVHG